MHSVPFRCHYFRAGLIYEGGRVFSDETVRFKYRRVLVCKGNCFKIFLVPTKKKKAQHGLSLDVNNMKYTPIEVMQS